MSKLPLPSEETKGIMFKWHKNWVESFEALSKRNGHSMAERIRTLMQADLEQNLDNDVVPTATLMTVKEIVGGIWVNRGGTVRDPSLKPVVCIACGKEQYHIPIEMVDHPAHGYCHHVKSKGPNDQCVCLDCLVATAILATSHDDLMSTKIEGFYNLNKWELQNTPEGKRVNAKLESYRATYFRNLPQLNDATDDEVLSCFTMKVERGTARRDTDFDLMLQYPDEFKLNSYVHPDTKIRPDEAHRPTAREWKKEWYAYPTKWLLEEGREILAAPHRASHPVKVARNLIFDAAALALKKATGRATLAEIMDAAMDATRTPVAAPAPAQVVPVNSWSDRLREDVAHWSKLEAEISADETPEPATITVKPVQAVLTSTQVTTSTFTPKASQVETLWQCLNDDSKKGWKRYKLVYGLDAPAPFGWTEYKGGYEECREVTTGKYLDRDFRPEYKDSKEDFIETVVFEVGELFPDNFGQLGDPAESALDKPRMDTLISITT